MTASAPDHLYVAECFGPTFQGEGPHAGQRSVFLRLNGCNLTCSWCDTKFTWDFPRLPNNGRRVGFDEVHEMLYGAGFDDHTRLVITGGEPLLQREALEEFIGTAFLGDIDIETNGTLPPLIVADIHYNVSPKLAHANVNQQKYSLRTLREFLNEDAIFKFVCTSPGDLEEIKHNYSWIPPHRIWVMPEGISSEGVLTKQRELAEGALLRHYNLSTRLHTLLWEDQRAR